MVISFKKHFATEKRSLAWCVEKYPLYEKQAKNLIKKIHKKFKLSPNSKILEIGTAQGLFMIALNRLGYDCEGIESCEEAINVSKKLTKKFNCKLNIKKGFAENLPFEDNSFNMAIANAVIEHVKDVKKVFSEAYRVLKPRGCFYFSTASSLCPKQSEIRFFPFFSWYPNSIKIKIMNWAIKNKPSLVGYTTTPAVNWFSPWKSNKLLKQARFKKIYDRWDLFIEGEVSTNKKLFLRIIKSNKIARFLADIIKPRCSYLAIKEY